MFVLTIDQRGSQQGHDRVPELLALLADIPTVLSFERSVGDEIQGAVNDAGQVTEVALRALRAGGWYVGIGIGGVDQPLPDTTRAAGGSAFVAARRAVDRAKKTGERVPLSVQIGAKEIGAKDSGARQTRGAQTGTTHAAAGDPQARADAAQAVLVLIGQLVASRTEAEWRVVDLLTPGVRGGQVEAAAKLGISAQAVSRAVLRSGWVEEHAGRAAANILLGLADATNPSIGEAGTGETSIEDAGTGDTAA